LLHTRVPRESLPDPKVDADPDRALITLLPMQRSMSKEANGVMMEFHA
jgi:hypothetical protein